MPDAQFLAAATQAAPLDYTLPGAQELLLKACFAHYDGSGAAGAYLPTLQLLGPAGDTIAEIPMDSSVAAGSSVEATWAPFLRSAVPAAAGPITGYSSVRTSIYVGDPAISVPAGGGAQVTWQSFWASDLSLWGTGRFGTDISHNQAGDRNLQVLQAGLGFAICDTQWEAGNYARDVIVLGGNARLSSLFPYHLEQEANTTNGVNGLPVMPRDTYMAVYSGVQGGSVADFNAIAANYDAVPRNLEHIQIYAYWWANLGTDTVIYGSG